MIMQDREQGKMSFKVYFNVGGMAYVWCMG